MRTALFLAILVTLAACGDKTNATHSTGLPASGISAGLPTGTTSGTPPGTPTGTPMTGLAIAGAWTDTWGTEHAISDVSWSMGFPGYAPAVFWISAYDNAGQWVIAQNDPANSYFPDQWSRMDWVLVGMASDLHFCQTGFMEASEGDAMALAPADSADLDTGCGGFAWTPLSP